MAPTPVGRNGASPDPVLAESISDWSRLSSRSFVPLTCATTAPRTFRAGLVGRDAGSLHVTHLRFGRHVVERTPGDAGDGRYKVNLQLEGRCVVEQADRRSVLEPGDLALYDTSAPYRLEFPEESRLLVLMFDHGVLDLPPAAAARLRARRLGPEAAVHAMVVSFLASMADHMDALTGMNAQRLGNSALDLLTTSFNLELDDQVAASAHEKDRLRAAVHDYAEAHLKGSIGLQVRRADAVGDRIFRERGDARDADRRSLGLSRRGALLPGVQGRLRPDALGGAGAGAVRLTRADRPRRKEGAR